MNNKDSKRYYWKDLKNGWVAVDGYNKRYYINPVGEVVSVKNELVKIMKPTINRCGYVKVHLSLNGKAKGKTIHRLLAQAFIPTVAGKEFVNHKNGVKHDNRLENLEWCTPSENVRHAKKNNLLNYTYGTTHPRAKLNEADIPFIRNSKLTNVVLSKRFNVTPRTILKVKHRISWLHVA